MGVSRRDFIKAGAAGAALLVAGPSRVLGQTQTFPAGRTSRLFPGNGRVVVHSDLHNHSLLSDGATAAEEVFGRMRAVDLDVAALTDHALFGKAAGKPCSNAQCNYYMGIDEESWQRIAELADASNADGAFVAMRGFEWTTGTIGHVNVWFTEEWVDSFTTMGIQSPRGLTPLLGVIPEPGPSLAPALGPLFDQLPETATMDLFYDWLQTNPGGGPFGGGSDGLAGFNHPNEFGNFESFKFVPEVVERIVSCEALNMDRDFLFWGHDDGMPSPLNACLNAGWKVGMLGVSDEHFDKWGDNRARGGLWLKSLTRDGVREAMESRRMFATFERGLRLDAAANGVQMGRAVGHRAGPVRFDLDLDHGPNGYGRDLRVQLLRPGNDDPVLAHEQDVRLGGPTEPVISFTVPIDVADGDWALLRVTDPGQAADEGTPEAFRGAGRGIAYASPFWFDPDAPAGAAPVDGAAAEVAGVQESRREALPATGGSTAVAAAGALAAAAALAARRLMQHDHDHPHDHDHAHE